MHANNEVGTIQPIEDCARIAHEHGVLFHTDAAQSVGKIPTNVSRLGVDLLSIAGHKAYAPKGVGALFVWRGVSIEPLIHGAGHEGVTGGHAVLKTLCGYDPTRLIAFAGRFSAPVFPGETIRTEMWRDGAVVSFRARVVERDVIAINNGRAEVKP